MFWSEIAGLGEAKGCCYSEMELMGCLLSSDIWNWLPPILLEGIKNGLFILLLRGNLSFVCRSWRFLGNFDNLCTFELRERLMRLICIWFVLVLILRHWFRETFQWLRSASKGRLVYNKTGCIQSMWRAYDCGRRRCKHIEVCKTHVTCLPFLYDPTKGVCSSLKMSKRMDSRGLYDPSLNLSLESSHGISPRTAASHFLLITFIYLWRLLVRFAKGFEVHVFPCVVLPVSSFFIVVKVSWIALPAELLSLRKHL